MAKKLRIWVIGASEICYLGMRQALSIDQTVSEVNQLPADAAVESLRGAGSSDICVLSSCQLNGRLIPLCVELHAETPEAPILIWAQDNRFVAEEIFKAGASAYVCSCSPKELSKAIEALRQGYQYFGSVSCQYSCSGDNDAGVVKLTARQEQIHSLVRMGLSDKEIAGRLGISPHTVRSHLRAIFEIAGVRRRSSLARQDSLVDIC